MSWKNIVITGLLCVVASPVLAQPSITVTDAGVVAGNRNWTVSVAPNATGFVPNTSLAIELDLTFGGTINSFLLNSALWNKAPVANVGNNPFTGTITETVLDTVPANDTLFIAAGSELYATSAAQLLANITTLGTTGGFEWGNHTIGVGAGAYETARIAQNGLNVDNLAGIANPIPGGCIDGDFSCSGAVGSDDLTLLLDNWGAVVPPTPAGWIGTPPTPTGIGSDELSLLLDNWGAVAGAGSASLSAVPEPASLALVFLGCAALGLTRRRV